MCHYLSKRNPEVTVLYALNVLEALETIELQRPDIIYAQKDGSGHLEDSLHNIINSTNDYDPDVFLYGTSSRKEGSTMDQLNKIMERLKDKLK
jgi:hypothetical protein